MAKYLKQKAKNKEVIMETLQTTFNTDTLEELIEDGVIENVEVVTSERKDE